MVTITEGSISTVTLIIIVRERYILININRIGNFFVIYYFISNRFSKLEYNKSIVHYFLIYQEVGKQPWKD